MPLLLLLYQAGRSEAHDLLELLLRILLLAALGQIGHQLVAQILGHLVGLFQLAVGVVGSQPERRCLVAGVGLLEGLVEQGDLLVELGALLAPDAPQQRQIFLRVGVGQRGQAAENCQ